MSCSPVQLVSLPKHERREMVNGDIRSFLTYVPDEDGNKEPALALAPTYHRFHGKVCYCIALSSAFKYAPEGRGEQIDYMKKLFIIAKVLGFDGDIATTESTAKKLDRIINNRIQELLEMAEYDVVEHERDRPDRAEIGEVTVFAEGDEINTVPMLQDVAEYDVEPINVH